MAGKAGPADARQSGDRPRRRSWSYPPLRGNGGARPIPVDAATSNMSIVAGIAQDSGTNWSQWQIQLSCTVPG
jgi:hypothetical protein